MHEFNLLYTLITIVAVLGVILSTCGFLIYVERKVAAYVQDRYGPNRVGPWGLLQSLADGLKFILKEDIIPGHVDKVLYLLAPALAVSTALLAFAVVPFGATTPRPTPPVAPAPISPHASEQQLQQQQTSMAAYQQKLELYRQAEAKYNQTYQFVIAPGVDIGILFVFAVASLSVYGVILGGWSANNKYSMMGGLRSSAQIVSYEIPMGLSVVGVVLLAGSLNLEHIIHAQHTTYGWFILYQPLAFLLFMVAAFAETNRLPFDLPEAEQELVGGYHTEYSAMKFALFFLGEYTHMVTTSFLMVILFFGGWHLPFVPTLEPFWLDWVIKLLIFAGKMTLFIFFFMLVRWTLPRFRFDQLMSLAWKVMIPLALLNLLCVMFARQYELSPWWLLLTSAMLFLGAGWFGTQLRPPPPPLRRPLPTIHNKSAVRQTAIR